ncbi:hypothetical protein [Cupriavidus nantongensis]|uniref:hypothetical protein n=1 Tax=Cupriavidus nantongensis TaxID=1796606 RepID=UPI00358EE770
MKAFSLASSTLMMHLPVRLLPASNIAIGHPRKSRKAAAAAASQGLGERQDGLVRQRTAWLRRHLPTPAKGAIKMLRRAASSQCATKITEAARNFLPFCHAVQHKSSAREENRFKLTQANAFSRHVR